MSLVQPPWTWKERLAMAAISLVLYAGTAALVDALWPVSAAAVSGLACGVPLLAWAAPGCLWLRRRSVRLGQMAFANTIGLLLVVLFSAETYLGYLTEHLGTRTTAVVTARQRWGGKSRERYSLTYRYVIDGRQHSRTQEVSESKYHYAQDGKTITLTYLPVWPALAHTGDTDFSRQRTEILISVCLIIEATLGYVYYRHPPRARGAAI